ncbi:MAG: glycosyltransferase [Opitutaceae bacterium]|jgi:glycosyltransferase involved in cell wall biosynthesis|nr:glycosyltransferase [Opitutaceae bacterium]
MKICHLVPSLEERHGGPSKSVRALANAQADVSTAVELLTTLECGQPVAATREVNERSVIHTFPRVTPRGLSRSPALQEYLSQARFDYVHYHSLWLRPLHYAHQAAQRLAVPLIISPRGMLSGWAYRHHHWRKRLAAAFIHRGAMAAASGWHATSAAEAEDIRALGFKQPVCISPNGVLVPSATEMKAARTSWQTICPATKTRPVALFYSRFHRKKRLQELITLWLAAPRGDWLLLIVGVAEDYTTTELSQMLQSAEATNRIAVFDGADRPPPYAVASLFLLPSHSENFGLVIVEALASGVPALVTDTTPWSGLNTKGCGWCVSWENFDSALTQALSTPLTELALMGQRGRTWAERDFSWSGAAHLLTEFYKKLRHASA